MVLPAVTGRRSTTFDFGDEPVDETIVEDVESSADTLVTAGGTRRSRFARILHRPLRGDGRGVNWGRVGAVAGVVGVAVAITFGLIQVL